MEAAIRFYWHSGEHIVEIRVLIPPMPPFAVGMSPDQFWAVCDMVVGIATPFITDLKEKLAKAEAGDLTMEITGADIDKLMRLKQEWEKNREGDDEKRA